MRLAIEAMRVVVPPRVVPQGDCAIPKKQAWQVLVPLWYPEVILGKLCRSNPLNLLAPRAGFEPATNRLTAGVFVGLFNQASTPTVQARPSGLPAIARALTW